MDKDKLDAIECEDVESGNTQCCHCQGKIKKRDDKEYQALMNRLNRIEGQVRGIKKMLEADAYCTDVLNQVAAVNAALNGFGVVLLENHIKTCVADDIRNGNEETIDDLMKTLRRLMK